MTKKYATITFVEGDGGHLKGMRMLVVSFGRGGGGGG